MLMKKNLSSEKILLISNMYPSKKFPHYGVFVKNTEEMLRKNGFDTICVAIHKQTGSVEKLWAYIWFHVKVFFHVLVKKYACVYAHYISHTSFALLMIKKLRPHMRIVVNVHGNDIVPEDEHDRKYLPLVHRVKEKVDFWIAPSNYFKEVLQKEYQIPSDRIVIYPSGGIDCVRFVKKDKAKCKEKLFLTSDNFVVGFVGRIEKNKGWNTLVEALSEIQEKIPQLKCVIVGTGKLEAELEQLIGDKRLHKLVIRIPLVSQDKLVDLYNAMDIFCLPSYRKSESLALAGLEAMACGCIVVGSNMAGPATYIKEGVNGFLFQPQSADELAEKMENIYVMPEKEREKVRECAGKTANQYDKEKVKEALLEVFRNLRHEK